MDVFEEQLFGNEIWRWIAYGGIVFLALMASRTVTFFFKNIVPRFTKKTRFKADDLVLGIIRKPVSILILLSGLYFGLYLLAVDHDTTAAEWPLFHGLYYFTLTILVVYMAATLYGDLLRHYLAPIVEATETKLDDQLLPLAVKGGRFIIWAMGLMIAFSNAGVDVTSLIAGLGIGGLALAMAAKDTVANIFGGASIFADRPFEIGDTITVKGSTGTVEEIGVRTTRIRTFEDTVFILPNAVVADSPLENISRRRKRKRTMSLGLTYDTTYDKLMEAKKLMADILDEVGGLEPDPTIRFDEFGDSALILKVIFWVSDPSEYFAKMALINETILKKFSEAGLEFAFPSQTLYVNKLN